MKRIILVASLLLPVYLSAQQTNKTFTVGHLLDSAMQKFHIHTEFSFGKAGGLFSPSGPYLDRSLILNVETSFKVGVFPVKRFLVGWDFSPQFSISDLGFEGFRWSTGPFVRYYFPLYRITKKNELKSPLALFVFFNYHVGQYNPMIINRPFDGRFTHGFSTGIGLTFKLKKNLCLNMEAGPRYDFLSGEFSHSGLSYLLKIGLSYSFASKKDIADKKYRKINSKVQ